VRNKILRIISICLIFEFLPDNKIVAQKRHSDNGDGTYTNPLIFADFPDPDVIRVDSVYMVSTSSVPAG
jgi:hypothetical protein